MMKIDRYKERIQNMLFMRIFPDKHAQLSEVSLFAPQRERRVSLWLEN